MNSLNPCEITSILDDAGQLYTALAATSVFQFCAYDTRDRARLTVFDPTLLFSYRYVPRMRDRFI